MTIGRLLAAAAALLTVVLAHSQQTFADSFNVPQRPVPPAIKSTTTTLTTITGGGVSGNLKPGTHSYSTGAQVKYSFAPANGYSQAVVIIDGAAAPSQGTLVMNTSHYLWSYGDPTNGTSFDKSMIAPTKATEIPYPNFFQKQPAISVSETNPYCVIASDTIAYPTSYLGSYQMPEINGAPLPSSVTLGVGMKDYWGGWMTDPSGVLYGALVPQCNIPNGLNTAFVDSLPRIKQLGADHVNIYREVNLINSKNPQLGFDPSQPAYSETDATISWMVAQAKSAGLKFHEYFNIVSPDDNGVQWNASNENATWEQAFLTAWQSFLLAEGALAQQNGVAAMCADWMGENQISWANPSLYISMLTANITKLRSVFHGKIFLCGNLYASGIPPWANQVSLLRSVDGVIIQLGIEGSLTQSDIKSFSVATVKGWYTQAISALAYWFTSYRPPIIWEDQIDSNLAALEQGKPFVDDGAGCTSNGNGGCLQNSEVTDFSVQAIAYEGYLEAIAAQTAFPTLSVDTFAYWYTDTMLPVPCAKNAVCGFFPNFGWNFRDKPAEAIVYQWFKH